MSKNEINEIIKKKQAIHDLKVDKKINKIGDGNKHEKYPIDKSHGKSEKYHKL